MSTLMDGNARSMSQSSDAQLSPGPGKCYTCRKGIRNTNQLVLCCTYCQHQFHTGCLTGWNEIKTPGELAFMKRTGIHWYCTDCEPKLANLLYLPSLTTSLDSLTKDIREMRAENREIREDNLKMLESTTKFREQAATLTGVADDMPLLRQMTAKIDKQLEDTKAQNARYERSCNVILHKLEEEGRTASVVYDICNDLEISTDNVAKVTRLGRRNMDLPKDKNVRPTKITFTNPQTRNDFLHAYYLYDDKLGTFATPDLSKEEQHREYLLRSLRNKLKSENKSVKYQVRNGLLMGKEPDSTWQIIEIEEGQLTKIDKELKTRRDS